MDQLVVRIRNIRVPLGPSLAQDQSSLRDTLMGYLFLQFAKHVFGRASIVDGGLRTYKLSGQLHHQRIHHSSNNLCLLV